MSYVGKLYLGDRETGKTTRLYHLVEEYILQGKRVLVIDSATEHEDKSIFCWLKKQYKDAYIIDSCEKNKIKFPDKLSEQDYPADEEIHDSFLYLCDASYYLEQGYLYPVGSLREQERCWYKKLAMQVTMRLLDRVDIVIYDEIEFIDESREVLELMLEKNIQLFMTLHYFEGLCRNTDLIFVERVE